MKKKKSSFSRCLNAPVSALRRLRDIYVRCLGGCAGAGAGAGSKGRGGGRTAGIAALMSRGRNRGSFGPSNRFVSGDEDFKDLVRASSHGRAAASTAVPRSHSSVPAIGRIDEEAPSEFAGDLNNCPRSQSSTVVPGRRRLGAAATASS
ncbi:hypothetical protein KSP39_PZI012033 [Platanthera zijinensis]|uniref:Uncharacterized protein n=1 Tax=Platanthera zijinensis TaxID=2320716 RepID=A0AAP0G4Y8_9ASPA